jgi:hypothetical protein
MCSLPHTLDNLSKKEKEKVFEMLRQLNELKKRCASLEQQLEVTEHEHQRLAGREELRSRQLESTEAKLLEAVELAKESQVEVESLTAQLQTCESERESLTATFHDCQSEGKSLRDAMDQFKPRGDRMLVTTSTQARIILCEAACGTADPATDRHAAAVQTVPGPALAQAAEAPSAIAPRTGEPPGQRRPPAPPEVTRAVTSMDAAQVEADDDLTQLISLLNSF